MDGDGGAIGDAHDGRGGVKRLKLEEALLPPVVALLIAILALTPPLIFAFVAFVDLPVALVLLAAALVPCGAPPAAADHDAPCLETEVPGSERLADTHTSARGGGHPRVGAGGRGGRACGGSTSNERDVLRGSRR